MIVRTEKGKFIHVGTAPGTRFTIAVCECAVVVIIRLVNPASLWVVFLLYAIAMLVGITRLYVEAYYPRDVLAEAILDLRSASD